MIGDPDFLLEPGRSAAGRAVTRLPAANVEGADLDWARAPEAEVLPVCEELGIGLVPWSPLCQGFLTGAVSAGQSFEKTDVRSWFPQFTPEAMAANQPRADLLGPIAADKE